MGLQADATRRSFNIFFMNEIPNIILLSLSFFTQHIDLPYILHIKTETKDRTVSSFSHWSSAKFKQVWLVVSLTQLIPLGISYLVTHICSNLPSPLCLSLWDWNWETSKHADSLSNLAFPWRSNNNCIWTRPSSLDRDNEVLGKECLSLYWRGHRL